MKRKSTLYSLLKNPYIKLDLLLLGGAVINLLYFCSNLFSFFRTRDAAFLIVALYHSVILAVRLYLFGYRELVGGGVEDELRVALSCRNAGAVMLVFDFLAAFVMIYTVTRGNERELDGIVIAVFAAYTVYALASSVYGMIIAARRDALLSFAARNLRFCAALLSVFNLAYSLISRTSVSPTVLNFLNVALGFAVFSLLIALALYLIRKSTREIARTRRRLSQKMRKSV